MGSNLTECCTRCGRPITRDSQTCFFKGARWLCVPPSDNTVIQVDRLLLRTGDNYGKPAPILENYYAPAHPGAI